MITKDAVVEKIKTVKDPEINLDVWTMGLIYEVDILSEEMIRVIMTYTTPLCPFGSALKEQVHAALQDLGFTTIALEVTFNPPWQPSEELRTMLGI
ncbi:MAG: hypothetical protein UY92_C0006G0101 [Candidatus Magasanikbacteria bacterium GW2011_GWA2_56_11]|uniref:MIP18 family-like domain-containing protein n=1 Tax=Candidatus Magasanikbacteria bacterium GW2011_GWA2_56_11 TaxID=1619044 RepID=A0A0G1YH46_9BACT|nr:MAG: hypothetical protein UY92_C0006G0101 [Candidatus Magasanikbacteria bacterium GW2011_GWA2_56_11]